MPERYSQSPEALEVAAAPCATSASISDAVYPAQVSTSTVCTPGAGGGPWIAVGVPVKVTG
jgi:hypothetical protein